MGTIFTDSGLVNIATNVLQGTAIVPKFLAPFQLHPLISPSLVYADLGVDTSMQADIETLWSFSLNPFHWLTANVDLTLDFPASKTGQLYYGIALYDASSVLYWVSFFDLVYVVPSGGAPLDVPIELTFSDLSIVPTSGP